MLYYILEKYFEKFTFFFERITNSHSRNCTTNERFLHFKGEPQAFSKIHGMGWEPFELMEKSSEP